MESSEDEEAIHPFGWGRNKKSRAAQQRLEMGERYLSNRKGRSVVHSQGLNVLLLAAVAGGLGFIARKLQAGGLHKPARAKQDKADTSSGGEDEEEEDGEEGDSDDSAEDAPPSSEQHAGNKGSAVEGIVPANRDAPGAEDVTTAKSRAAEKSDAAVPQEAGPSPPKAGDSAKDTQGPESGGQAAEGDMSRGNGAHDAAPQHQAGGGQREGSASLAKGDTAVPGFKVAEGVHTETGGAKEDAEHREAERREEAAAGGAEPQMSGKDVEAAMGAEKSAQAELEDVLGPETESLEDTPEERDAAAMEAGTKEERQPAPEQGKHTSVEEEQDASQTGKQAAEAKQDAAALEQEDQAAGGKPDTPEKAKQAVPEKQDEAAPATERSTIGGKAQGEIKEAEQAPGKEVEAAAEEKPAAEEHSVATPDSASRAKAQKAQEPTRPDQEAPSLSPGKKAEKDSKDSDVAAKASTKEASPSTKDKEDSQASTKDAPSRSSGSGQKASQGSDAAAEASPGKASTSSPDKKAGQPAAEKEATSKQEASQGEGRTLERKPSKEEIATFVTQKLGVHPAEQEAPIAFTSEADTLGAITEELLSKESEGKGEAGKRQEAKRDGGHKASSGDGDKEAGVEGPDTKDTNPPEAGRGSGTKTEAPSSDKAGSGDTGAGEAGAKDSKPSEAEAKSAGSGTEAPPQKAGKGAAEGKQEEGILSDDTAESSQRGSETGGASQKGNGSAASKGGKKKKKSGGKKKGKK